DRVAHADLTLVLPWFPFPVGPVVYWHETSLTAAGRSGPLAGRALAGSSRGVGAGFTVRIMGEWFRAGRTRRPRGLGMTLGYIGFWDFTPGDVPLRALSGSGTTQYIRWRSLRGEGLQAGVEYEF
ncbi:MAG: hypothetical protein AAB368_04060, partial [bacterium]